MRDHTYRLTAKKFDLPDWHFSFTDPGDEIFTVHIWQELNDRWIVLAYWDYWDYFSSPDDYPVRVTEQLNKVFQSLDEALDAVNLFMRRWGRFTRPRLTKEVLAWAQLQPGDELQDFELENQPELTIDELYDIEEAA